MRWLKIALGSLLGIVVLAIAVLWLLGRGEAANRLQASIEIDRPPSQVFPWLTEQDKLKQWVDWLVEVRGTGEPGVGAKRVWVMDDPNMKERVETTNEIIVWEPPVRLGVRTSMAGAFDGTLSYVLTDLGAGRTRVETSGEWRIQQWFFELIKPLVMSSARKKMESDLARLKTRVEAEPAAPAGS